MLEQGFFAGFIPQVWILMLKLESKVACDVSQTFGAAVKVGLGRV